jgi:hypothetical protein
MFSVPAAFKLLFIRFIGDPLPQKGTKNTKKQKIKTISSRYGGKVRSRCFLSLQPFLLVMAAKFVQDVFCPCCLQVVIHTFHR